MGLICKKLLIQIKKAAHLFSLTSSFETIYWPFFDFQIQKKPFSENPPYFTQIGYSVHAEVDSGHVATLRGFLLLIIGFGQTEFALSHPLTVRVI